MSNFPGNYDDDTTLPVINDNLTELGGEAINALRDAVFNIEQNIGLGAAGTTPSIAARLGLLINPDGTPNPSALTSLGLVTLPINNIQIATNAGIQESKLALDYRTQDLFNYIRDVARDVNIALGWISITGVKLEPHLMGLIYRHDMSQIDVAESSTLFLNNKFRVPRDNTNSYTVVNDLNNELLAHQWADGSVFGTIANVITNDGSTYPSNYAHTASGIFLQSSVFSTVPQTANNVQLFAEFVDSSSLLLLGSRIQNLYANGISRNSRSSALLMDGYGQSVVPLTAVTTFLRYSGGIVSHPVDDIFTGDDIVQFTPMSGTDGYNTFISQFTAINVGDILRVNYGTVEVDFIILEKRYVSNNNGNTFIVRINGKNLEYTTTALASVNRPLFNNNKYGVLAMAPVTTGLSGNPEPSLIIGAPRGAQALGINFDASLFDNSHYSLYLALYPTGNPSDGYLTLPAIDVTGNSGATPGQYTLDSIVLTTNNAFRVPGFNYRFIAFQYQGEFGIMLADSYNNASFSVISVILNSMGMPDTIATAANLPNNVVGVLPSANGTMPDPLGFGPFGANIASPPYLSSYASSGLALQPTRLFVPLKRNNYYVDGVEKEQLSLDVDQSLDIYGDGYWPATVTNITVYGNRTQVTYSIQLDLSTSQLANGKTLVVQSADDGGIFPNDFGRFIIDNVVFQCSGSTPPTTLITVYDAVHGIGIDGYSTLIVGNEVNIYFDSSSVSFNAETATDFAYVTPFKRYFEVFIDEDANTFTHERGRFYLNTILNNLDSPPAGTILLGNTLYASNLNVVSISPKLQGYQFGNVNKITLNLINFTASTGVYDGYLCSWNNSGPITNIGPTISGKQGQTTRFYDQTNINYIDINLDFTNTLSNFVNGAIDIQLFPSLALDEQIMILGSCQINDNSQAVTYLTDLRQFGNTSEEQLTTSALNYIAAPTRLLQENGIIRGFDLVSLPAPVFASLVGTFGVVHNSNAVSSSTSQTGTIVAGSVVVFAAQPGVLYTVLSVISGTSFILTNNYLGPTATATTATIVIFFPNNVTFTGGEAIVNGKIIQMNNQSVNLPIVQELVGPFSSQIPNNVITWFICVNDKGEFTLVASTDFKPSSTFASTYLATGAESRLFYVLSPNSGSAPAYTIRATYFADLIQNQKDVAVVGVVTSTILAAGNLYNLTSVTYQDARRYVYNGYGGLQQPLTFGSIASFRTYNALNTWLDQLTNYQSATDNKNNIGLTVLVKDNIVLSSTITLNYGLPVIFQGDGGSFTIPIANGITLGSNVSFNNLQFNYTFDPTSPPDGIYNTANLANPFNAAIYCLVDQVNGNKNISFRNCLFTSPNQYRYGFIGFRFLEATCLVENIEIIDNRFETSFAGDDQLAVITFSGPEVSPILGTGARLNNCVIERNFCNKNQMIEVAPFFNTFFSLNLINDLLVATNLRIIGNTCGAINVMIKQDYPLTVPNVNFDLDKSAGAIIAENTCKFIFSGFDSGRVMGPTSNTAINYVQNGFNLLVGNLTIINNNVSYIWTGTRITTSTTLGAPTIIIQGNKLTAYNPAFLVPYGVTLSTSSIAIYMDKVVGT